MLQLSTGALLLLLPWFGGLVLGEISNNFSQCLGFFYDKTPPKGISAAGYQPICQRYKNQYRFASLYHRQHRAPLYSAYILSPADGKRPNSSWMYEPQVRVLCTVGVTGKKCVLARAVCHNCAEAEECSLKLNAKAPITHIIVSLR